MQLSSHACQKSALRLFLGVIGLVVSVVGRGRVVDFFPEGRAELILVGKGKTEIVRPARVAGDEQGLNTQRLKPGFQIVEGLD